MAKKKAKKKTTKKTGSTSKSRTPKATSTPESFDELLAKHDQHVGNTALELRKLVYEVLPKAEEAFYGGKMAIALYSIGNDVCGIQPLDDRCNFYLTRGVDMKDAKSLLEGKGRGIRHIKVSSVEQVGADVIRSYIRQGKKLATA